jgi:four helix bundle protein
VSDNRIGTGRPDGRINQNFRDLQVWRKSQALSVEIYRETARFPRGEMYGLTSQIRRAATSISANIAEGCGRGGRAELARYVQMARGSASELDCHLELARDLGFLPPAQYAKLVQSLSEIERMLTALRQTLLERSSSSRTTSRDS